MALGSIPDIEALVINVLNNSQDITDIAGENSASTQLNEDAVLPKIRVTLAGGTPRIDGWLYAPRINIEAWANDKETSFDLINKISEVLFSELNDALFDEGIVTGIEQDVGLSWIPDPLTNTPRYTLGFVIYNHPNI